MAKKKKQEDPPPGCPLYMLTYGDMMTLLLCFFVLLFSFSTIDQRKFDHMKWAFNSALGVMPGSWQYVPEEGMVEGKKDTQVKKHAPKEDEEEQMIEDMKAALKAAMQQEMEMKAMQQQMQKQMQQEIQKKKVEIKEQKKDDGIIIRVTDLDGPKFDLGKSKLNPAFMNLLDVIAEKLKNPEYKEYRFIVQGHTDKLPINTPEYPSNFELSVARSMAVLNYLKGKGIPAQQLSAAGFGEYEPVEGVEFDRALGSPANRRVDILVIKDPRKVKETGEQPEKKKKWPRIPGASPNKSR